MLALIGIGNRKIGDGPVEYIALTQEPLILAGSPERAWAWANVNHKAGVFDHHIGGEDFDQWLDLPCL